MIRVLIVEDHPMFRDGLHATLDSCPDIDVVATAATAAQALAAAVRHHPDVVVMDLRLPDGSGVTLTRTVRDRLPACAVLALTSHDDDDTVAAAVQAGALGFVTKDAAGETITDAVRAVAHGHGAFTGGAVGSLARRLAGPAAGQPTPFTQLSRREHEILALLAAGHSNAYIADHFVLSLKTVRNYVSSVFTKLGVASRAEAVVAARRAGLGLRGDAATPEVADPRR
jgi:DNA-binding NarL/FixJ family response regulator